MLYLSKWRIVVLISVLLGCLLGYGLYFHGFIEDMIREGMRVTARLSIILFMLAFTASSLHFFIQATWTRWLLVNRRYIGLSFALSHFVHLVYLVVLVNYFPDRMMAELDMVGATAGSVGYIFLLIMTMTSFSQPRAWLGETVWRTIHLVGSYFLWFVFAYTYSLMSLKNATYLPALMLLLLGMGLRIWEACQLRKASQQTLA